MKPEARAIALKTRRQFLLQAARKIVVPVVTVYTIRKTTPKLFAREPW